MILGLVFWGFALSGLVTGQHWQSPCPRLFVYEPRGAESDRWYGILTVLNDAELNGVWLRLFFDRPFLQLGVYWPSEIKTEDHKLYKVRNRNYNLKARVPLIIRLFARYDPAGAPPQFLGYRLNAKTVCPEIVPEEVEVPTEPMLITSDVLGEIPLKQVENTPSLGNRSETVACGTVAVQARPLLLRGVPAGEGSYPWHVAIYDMNFSDLKYICGGSLISENHVITAGHCVTKHSNGLVTSTKTLQVYLGKYYLADWSGPHVQVRRIAKILRHPRYSAETYANDIAVLKLEDPVAYTNYIRPLCLWTSSEDITPLEGKLGVVVGWGLDETGHNSEKLIMTRMPVVDKETCIFSNPNFYGNFAVDGTYCAGYAKEGSTAACAGDSGGGMIFPVSGKSKTWQLRGIVSLSVNSNTNTQRCQSGNYIVFTDVAKFLGFIREAQSL